MLRLAGQPGWLLRASGDPGGSRAGRANVSLESGFRQATLGIHDIDIKLRDSSDSQLLVDILQKTVKHPVCVKYPPPAKFSRGFLSELIKKPSGDPVTLCESTAIVSHGTTGLVTWNAALYLAEWALENPALFTDRTVLELGSGAGLTGLAICKACSPQAYIFSDCHSRVLEQLRANVLLNGLAPRQHAGRGTPGAEKPLVVVAQLDWDLATAPQLSALQPDVVIAADVLYCPDTVLALLGVLRTLSACHSGLQPLDAYVAFTVRNPETCRLFTEELGKNVHG
ncbi:protein-lysine N-methyltransferase EEF2KMT [Echinops telfairi]|uniref:Protein-lysine N-methyltransferase EEF2KMT n=1 Tax=Echinops telfairi TaxID=9371 RepID=A0ABM0IRT5_ECHTE|nr:protein-lysine N-methyltransferase EEF2KMT [Echinops telfairi]